MTKLVKAILICFFGLLIFYPAQVLGQREVDDYLYQYEKYRDYQKNFEETRDKYLTYQTLTAKDELIKSGKNYLVSRALVLQTYLEVLKLKIKETQNIASDTRTELILSLDEEINWLKDYQSSINNLKNPDLAELLEYSEKLERKEDDYRKSSYRVLAYNLLGQVKQLQQESVAINFLLKEKTKKNQWLTTVTEGADISQKYIESAEEHLDKINSGGVNQISGEFTNFKQELEKARDKLLEILPYQQEILKEVDSD